MAMRHRMSKGKDKRKFTKHAVRVHHKNLHANPMRGGYRL